MRVKSFFLILIFLFFNFFHFNKAHSHLLCEVSLSSPESDFLGDAFLSPTERLIAYLNHLLEKGIMTDDQLSHFISELKGSKVINPFQGENGSTGEIQREGIQEYLDQSLLNQALLLEWARRKQREGKQTRVKRKETRHKTKDFHQKIEFHPVQVGRFQMGRGNDKVEVQLTYPIEVMSTPVTQKHWVDLMGRNPSRFQKGEDSVVVTVNDSLIKMQPDHPVENVNWWSALVFANRLSEKHGLKPAYVLEGIKWIKGTSPESGNLLIENGLVRIYANGGVHDPTQGDIYYQAEGYRLPTQAEQEYLLRAGGTADWKDQFGEDRARLNEYAWNSDNSDNKTHSVCELKPFVLSKEHFYDLYGNVWEWSWDWRHRIQGGENPVAKSNRRNFHMALGGAWDELGSSFEPGFRVFAGPYEFRCNLGFRLVRTIGRPKK